MSPIGLVSYLDVGLRGAVDIVDIRQINIANVKVVVSQTHGQLNVSRMEDSILYPLLLSCLRNK